MKLGSSCILAGTEVKINTHTPLSKRQAKSFQFPLHLTVKLPNKKRF